MAALLFREDPYLRACETGEIGRLAVARIRSEGKRNKRVTLALA